MRAMSVRANAKSNRHRKTHRVEPGGTGRKFMHLTRGGLGRESVQGVSRGHSSEEGRESGLSKGPKNQQKGDQRTDRRGVSAKKRRETRLESRDIAADWTADRQNPCGPGGTGLTGGGKSPSARKGVQEDA
jgi:hypothetical protein